VEVGVDGIIVSNHGARQLDYTPVTIFCSGKGYSLFLYTLFSLPNSSKVCVLITMEQIKRKDFL
jgi:hypothetical protein